MLLYRDSARSVPAVALREELMRALRAADNNERRLRLLLKLSELETALWDARAPGAMASSNLTDAAAQAWLGHKELAHDALSRQLTALPFEGELELRRPEGYAYYALDPASYAKLASSRAVEEGVAVIGIRSIGTSLSAVVRAAVQASGAPSERLTLRPAGHPWDRKCELDAETSAFVEAWRRARFLVVDEGPGLSGSSFLAVGELLERAGVAIDKIEFLTSHPVDAGGLCAPDAARRWLRFRATAVAEPPAPCDGLAAGAGQWRRWVYASEADYPATWNAMERQKYIANGPRRLVKFAGFAPYGDAARQRGEVLADAGFCPSAHPLVPGYLAHEWCAGTPSRATAGDVAQVLPRMAEYLAFRHWALPAPEAQLELLETMLHVNVLESLGIAMPAGTRLELERPVYADGRMLPHEWIRTPVGQVYKVDATQHGDDHLLPGPCDSAWDIAGAVIEWRLSASATEWLLSAYRARTGDDVKRRLHPYLMAYAAFRVGWCNMALQASDAAERPRLERTGQHYRTVLAALLTQSVPG